MFIVVDFFFAEPTLFLSFVELLIEMRKSSMCFFSIVSLKSTPNCVILKQIFGCNASGDIPKNLMTH